MAKPKMFISIDSAETKNPIAMALGAISKAFGADLVEELVSDTVEATIAVTNSPKKAFQMINETQRTSIVLTYFSKIEKAEADSLASSYPDRIAVAPYVSFTDGQMEIGPFLMKLIAEKSA